MVMAENVVENRICSVCGAEIRPQALFCYNCGSSVAPEIGAATAQTNHDNKANETLDKPIEMPTDALIGNREAENKSAAATNTAAAAATNRDRTNLKSAAALKRERAKSGQNLLPPQRKKIEVVWEEPEEDAPNVWFIVAALVLTLLSVGILFAVLTIK